MDQPILVFFYGLNFGDLISGIQENKYFNLGTSEADFQPSCPSVQTRVSGVICHFNSDSEIGIATPSLTMCQILFDTVAGTGGGTDAGAVRVGGIVGGIVRGAGVVGVVGVEEIESES